MDKMIQISEKDNVAVAFHPVEKGTVLALGDRQVTVLEDIRRGTRFRFVLSKRKAG